MVSLVMQTTAHLDERYIQSKGQRRHMRTRAEAKSSVTRILVTATTTPMRVKIASLDQEAPVELPLIDGGLIVGNGGAGAAWVTARHARDVRPTPGTRGAMLGQSRALQV